MMKHVWSGKACMPIGILVFAIACSPSPASVVKASVVKAPVCRERSAHAYAPPVLDADFPDPAVIDGGDGFYYAYATQTMTDAKKMVNIQIARSRDLVTWDLLQADALPVKPTWARTTQRFWAPDVSLHDGKFFMYFSAAPDVPGGLCIAVAIADSPAGPFVDSGKPVVCGEHFVNIDPMAFDDPKTHKRLLYWGSGHKPIKVQELAPDRLELLSGSRSIDLIAPSTASASSDYEKLVEGVYVIERDGTYYLFYSGDNCCGAQAHYAVMVARAQSAFGPFEKMGASRGVPSSVVLAGDDRFHAPGHSSILRDRAGQDWIFYHAIDCYQPVLKHRIPDDLESRRIMRSAHVTFRDGWPHVEAR